ncbi:MAG: ATP-binding protein [Sporomusaceae bacterium]|nr:ATP-binding protein [Sporomusaceae bacterium]
MRPRLIVFSFCDYAEFKLVRPLVKCFLQKVLVGQYHMMEVAVNEAVNNALRFSEGKPCQLTMDILRGSVLVIRLKHQGLGLATASKRAQDSHKCLEEELWREGGRGLLIMQAAADCVFYNRQGTEILLAKMLSEPCLSQNDKKIT